MAAAVAAAAVVPLRVGGLFHKVLAHGVGSAIPLLLIHGMDSTGSTFDACGIGSTFNGHRTVIAVDLHGHGRSARSRDSMTLAECADDCAALLRELSIPRVHVMGHSLGARIALGLAFHHPELVVSVTMEDMDCKARTSKPSTHDLSTFVSGHATADAAVAHLVSFGYDEERVRSYLAIDRIFPLPDGTWHIGVSPQMAALVMRDVLTVDHLDVLRAVAARGTPIAALYATEPHSATSAASLQAMRDAIAPATMREGAFPRAGHSIHRTSARTFVEAVAAACAAAEVVQTAEPAEPSP